MGARHVAPTSVAWVAVRELQGAARLGAQEPKDDGNLDVRLEKGVGR